MKQNWMIHDGDLFGPGERETESAACNYHDLCVNLLKGTMGLISLLLCLITHSKLTFIIFYYNCDQGAWLQHVSSANISQAKSLVLQMISPIPLPLKKLPWQAVNWILKLIYFLLISPWKIQHSYLETKYETMGVCYR